ncbi:hypothetical protein [Mycobacterium sp. 852013-50091_SCH5140682]|uniref:DUF7302 family protein n=1 Tax=Mycobacterium sp. 852013-50091_SCH5140682 TaxID=1834109 RepID=UPI000AA1CF49|nr:hypothetical protein [Mycobacterium sp. 852013-50091_SCH5140682]
MKLTNTLTGVLVDVPDKLGEQLIAAGTYAKADGPARPKPSSTRAKTSRTKTAE